MVSNVHRFVVVLLLPTNVPALIKFAQSVVTALTNNAFYPSPNPPLATVSSLITKLDAAETAVKTRAQGTVPARNAAKAALVQALHDLKAYVESIANANPEQGEAMITSAALRAKTIPSRTKAALTVSPGDVSGTAKVEAKAVARRAAYEWQWSSDGGKTWTAVPPTLQARTTVAGLPVGTSCSFRFRALSRTGEGDWSQVVTYLVK
jgi:predicted phage tail protein